MYCSRFRNVHILVIPFPYSNVSTSFLVPLLSWETGHRLHHQPLPSSQTASICVWPMKDTVGHKSSREERGHCNHALSTYHTGNWSWLQKSSSFLGRSSVCTTVISLYFLYTSAYLPTNSVLGTVFQLWYGEFWIVHRVLWSTELKRKISEFKANKATCLWNRAWRR